MILRSDKWLPGFVFWGCLSVVGECATIGDLSSVLRSVQLLGYGIAEKPSADASQTQAAPVICSAEVPAVAERGTVLDVRVWSTSKLSLEGGRLIETSLRGSDGVEYARAQGRIVSVNEGASQRDTIPSAAALEKGLFSSPLKLLLRNPNPKVANQIAEKINVAFSTRVATAVDAEIVTVELPKNVLALGSEWVSKIQALPLETDDAPRGLQESVVQ